jgi:2-polyprenyl-3-methyl-5-hydroxy-6-metoxy-1,4-benzoquinol methylase
VPITPNFIERSLFFGLNQGPGPMMDIWNAVAFRAVLAGVRLNIFETLDRAELAPKTLANQLNLEENGVHILLRTLHSLGYVEKHGETYSNSRMTNKWLVHSSGMDFSPGFHYWAAILPLFDNLEESLHTGESPVNLYEWFNDQPQAAQDFQDYMVPLAKYTLDEIIARLKLPDDAKKLLDIGGGHAMYSIALCQKHLSLSATVFDSREALKAGRENIADAGLERAIQVQEGNFFEDDLGSGYDIALLFNIIHGLTPEQNKDLLRKVAGALNPGGTAVILEQFESNLPLSMSQTVINILGLSYYHLLGGKVYTQEEVESWFQESGFGNIHRINLRKVPGTGMVLGVSKSE